MGVAKELPPEDRTELQDVLVASKAIPPEQEALLQKALEPNGLLDQLGLVAEYLDKAKPYARYVAAVPIVEWILGWLFGFLPCDIPLASWLCWDGFGVVFTVAGFYGAYTSFDAIKAVALNPPEGLQAAVLNRDAN